MAMTDMGFGKSDKQLADAFGISVSDMKKIKKQIALEVTKPAPKKPVVKPKAPATKPPMNKPKGLNDYLDKGKTPPSKNKKLPSDADVILKGYNDKKTIAKLKNKKSK
jgi:hypothetical protein